ncbi:MAG: site-2 protease family protein [Deltaproteobacteria bacterium]
MIYLSAVLIISLIIVVHELGHLLAARLVSIPVKTFSIGFGPRLIGFTRSDTDYRLSLVPLGGYVEPAISSEEELYAIPLFRRVIFTLGGVAANIIFAVLMLFIYRMQSQYLPAAAALVLAGQNAVSFMLLIAQSIPSLLTSASDLAGVIGIVRQGGSFMAGSYHQIFSFAGILSLNLAVMNLLPLPVLDGGKVVFYILEKMAPPLRKISAGLSIAGWIVILGLTILATSNDVAALIS